MTTGAGGPATHGGAAEEALASVVHEDWGRLLGLLVSQYRRLDLAEDGLADAVEAAARHWPRDGPPASPAAWLMTAARRRVLDRLRAEAVAARRMPALAVEAGLSEEAQRVMIDPGDPEPTDERLRLVLLCAHPSLSREHAAALTLRLVLGVSTADVARLFLVPTPAMAARLTRARHRLADARFTVPTGRELVDRVGVVGEVAYLAFTAGYAPGSGADVLRADLAGEAVRLVRVLREVLPVDVHRAVRDDLDALLALMLLQHSRRAARVAPDGSLVLLPDQDRSRWRHDEIAEAVRLLTPRATAPPTAYLVQALVAAEHAVSPSSAATRWERIVRLYDELLTLGESPVVRLNRAVAVAEAHGPRAALRDLGGLELPGHRLPAVRAELWARCGEPEAALAAYDRAVLACVNDAERAHLESRRAEVLERGR